MRHWALGAESKDSLMEFSLVPSLQAGNVFSEVLPLVNKEKAEPPRMGSQPPGWEPVNAQYFGSAQYKCPMPNAQIKLTYAP
ncbi:hypothetical protein NSTC731_04496 [Nostoc sp. DSM 114167]|jgi:hypothetical protein